MTTKIHTILEQHNRSLEKRIQARTFKKPKSYEFEKQEEECQTQDK